MPRHFRRFEFAVLLLACAPLGAAHSAESEQTYSRTWSAEVGVGAEYDSNVSVQEVDVSTSQGDYALLLDAAFAVKQELPNDITAAFTYDFSQSNYDKFSQVDRQTHMLGLDVGIDLEGADPGLSVYYINSRLNGSEFLELTRVSPSVSGFLARKWFARGAYVYSDKTITNRKGRDATNNAGEADLYYFMRGLRSYFNIGYRYRDENAKADQYSYISNGLKIRFIQRFELFSRLTKLELAWRYEDRKYQSDTPSIGEKRHDQRNRLRLDYQIPVFGRAAVQLFAGYADYDSNFPPGDYDQTIVGTRFLYTW